MLKLKFIFTIIISLLFLLLSCNQTIRFNNNIGFKQVSGSGNITIKEIKTNGYDKITVSAGINVLLIKGAEGNITVNVDENLHEYLDISSNSDKLKIKAKKGF